MDERTAERRAERRIVTVLFVDIVGFTDLTLRHGPERMKRVLDEAFAQLGAIVSGHGGTVEKYIGDAVFALFGAPTAHADDPIRALRAAEACVRWAQERSAEVSVRAGVETGRALVDLAATTGDRQRMAVGACVNLAARLQAEAEPGEVFVGPTCHEATAAVAAFATVGTRSLKGIGPTEVWRLLRIHPLPTTTPSPFVGRGEELARLRDVFARSAQGRAGFALIVGPPGQGKTRLAEELIRDTGPRAVLLSARCRPGTEVGVRTPLRQLLESDVPDASPDRVVERASELLNGDAALVASALCHSTGIASDPAIAGLFLADQQATIARGWRSYLGALGRRRPVILWVEDLHWAGPHLVRLLDRLTFEADLPLLVLATARPEIAGHAGLRSGGDRTTIELGPLDAQGALTLARQVVADAIDVDRAEGNPLFIIELARSRGRWGEEVPLTVQAVIAARLDELEEDERDVLTRVAVCGETFTVRDAALLADREPAEIARTLGPLAHLRFIYALGDRYRFHHVLVRDVAYGRLPAAERMRLHARYAREGVDPEDAEALAHHWYEALRPPDTDWVWPDLRERAAMTREALEANLAAGRRLVGRNAFEQAQDLYQRALDIVREPHDIAPIEAAIGDAYHRNAQGDEAWQHRLRAIEAYRAANVDPPAEIYSRMLEISAFNPGYFRTIPPPGAFDRALAEGLALARRGNDRSSLVLLLAAAAVHGAPEPLAEAMALVDATPDPLPLAESLQRVAQSYMRHSRLAEADRLFRSVVALARRGAPVNEPEGILWRIGIDLSLGQLDEAAELQERFMDVSATRSPHTRSHALGSGASLARARGDWDVVKSTARDLRELIAANPESPFCVVGGAAFAHEAEADALAGSPQPPDLDALVVRTMPNSVPQQKSTLLVPLAMRGEDAGPPAREAYSLRPRIWDRQLWDLSRSNLVIAAVIGEGWDELAAELALLDDLARQGSRFAAALAAAAREEVAAARGGPKPAHAELRALGYYGLSALLSFRPAAQRYGPGVSRIAPGVW